jgi:hypothetical protein
VFAIAALVAVPTYAGKPGGGGSGGGVPNVNAYVCGAPPAQVFILIDSGRIAQDAAIPLAAPSVIHRECHCDMNIIQLGSATCTCSPPSPAEWMDCQPEPQLPSSSCPRTGCKDDGLVVTGCTRDGGSGANPKFKLNVAAQVGAPYGATTADVYLGYMDSTSLQQQFLNDLPVGAASLPKPFPGTVPLTFGTSKSFQLTTAGTLIEGVQPQGIFENGETENPTLYIVRVGQGQQARYSVYRSDDGSAGEFVKECY